MARQVLSGAMSRLSLRYLADVNSLRIQLEISGT
jgi:hypothetical protein